MTATMRRTMPLGIACTECAGTGHLPEYAHICGGRYFPCGGTGRERSRASATPRQRARHRRAEPAPYRQSATQHIRDFEEALMIEHIFAWIDVRPDERGQGRRY